MDAVKYLKEVKRMCSTHKVCEGCLIESICNNSCENIKKPEEIVAAVEKWAAEHPAKTRQSEFLKLYPNAESYAGVISICPQKLDKNIVCLYECGQVACYKCREQYWFAEVEE